MNDEQESPRYWWFDGATVQALKERLDAAGPGVIFKVNKDGNALTLEVIDPGQDKAARLAPLNESHPCPPICLE